MSHPETIRITCEGAATLPLQKLKPLQGDLKSLPDENFQRLKASILKYGITFPFFVWRNRKNHFIIDAHQRDKALRRIESEGFTIPPVPVVWIAARDEQEAREKILLCNSQYGQMTEQSLEVFITLADLKIAELKQVTVLPVDFSRFMNPPAAPPDKTEADVLEEKFQVVVECTSETEQHRIFTKLTKEGNKCKLLTF